MEIEEALSHMDEETWQIQEEWRRKREVEVQHSIVDFFKKLDSDYEAYKIRRLSNKNSR